MADPLPDKMTRATVPRSVWVLGFGSLLMDTSSELVHSLLPILLVTRLGASMGTLGVIEGVAEATAAAVKVLSGTISDHLGRRKPLVVGGYALSALTKPIFPLAGSVGWVFAARCVDRVGKGIRGSPRDALIADITPSEARGAAYGLRQGLDSVGALAGPLLAAVLMAWYDDDIRAVMWFAVAPALLTVGLLAAAVDEPGRAPGANVSGTTMALGEARRLPHRYWAVVLLGTVFTLARFSEAFLVVRARDLGFTLSTLPLVMVVMNVFYAGAAYPAGAASDRIGSRRLLFAGLALLVAADVVFAAAASPRMALAGAALWGVHMGLTQGLLSKLVADTLPAGLLGTGFGIFHLVTGGALLLASVVAGALWSAFGAPATFMTGAVFATVAMCGLLMAVPRDRGRAGG